MPKRLILPLAASLATGCNLANPTLLPVGQVTWGALGLNAIAGTGAILAQVTLMDQGYHAAAVAADIDHLSLTAKTRDQETSQTVPMVDLSKGRNPYFTGLHPGPCSLSVVAFDASGTSIGQARIDTTVQPGATTQVNITLDLVGAVVYNGNLAAAVTIRNGVTTYVDPVPRFQSLPLDAVANTTVRSFHGNLPLGDRSLGGIPFHLADQAVQSARAQVARYEVPCNVPAPVRLHLLLNSFDTWATQRGMTLGHVLATYSDGSSDRFPLVIGDNIREWSETNAWGPTVNDVTSPAVSQVYADGPRVVDRLSIDLPAPARARTLTSVALVDTLTSQAPSPAPRTDAGLVWLGVTVED